MNSQPCEQLLRPLRDEPRLPPYCKQPRYKRRPVSTEPPSPTHKGGTEGTRRSGRILGLEFGSPGGWGGGTVWFGEFGFWDREGLARDRDVPRNGLRPGLLDMGAGPPGAAWTSENRPHTSPAPDVNKNTSRWSWSAGVIFRASWSAGRAPAISGVSSGSDPADKPGRN